MSIRCWLGYHKFEEVGRNYEQKSEDYDVETVAKRCTRCGVRAVTYMYWLYGDYEGEVTIIKKENK